LTQEFSVTGNFPGQRTISYATDLIKDIIQKYVEPFSGKITEFPCPKEEKEKEDIYNGSFQYTTSRDRSWIHTDKWNNLAGVLFMTPDAPLSSGTAFYMAQHVKRKVKIQMMEPRFHKMGISGYCWNSPCII
jgi:hypothetical protein